MRYVVLFHSDLPETATRPLVRTLESLPLSVIRAGAAPARHGQIEQRQEVPVVTLASCPSRLHALRDLGPRAWIAILPAREGSEAPFAEAGASVVLRMPLERSALLSAVSRCLSTFEACDAGRPHIASAALGHARNHAPTG